MKVSWNPVSYEPIGKLSVQDLVSTADGIHLHGYNTKRANPEPSRFPTGLVLPHILPYSFTNTSTKNLKHAMYLKSKVELLTETE